ncbi:bifunctional nuclease domain-containing protein [Thiohalorhabdus sp.]|uniref:bifunctional nuclease domain-containing protein n=1 Tax=Thiohalorhabdus sp. TaxID=3094134 RepID=UPI002FC2BB78
MTRSPLRRPLIHLAACLLLAAPGGSVQARELAADRKDFVEVELAGMGITTTGAPAALLRPPDSEEVVPIFIGHGQARAIVQGLREADPPRPMTHDLLSHTLRALETRLERVYVDDVRDGTFYGMLELDAPGRHALLRVDSRPSDALALALRTDATILAAPRVLEAARRLDVEGMEERIAKAAGITVNAAGAELREAMDLPDREGVVVSEALGPARRAGLRSGALITEVNGETPSSPGRFRELLRATPAGEKARITFWQEGESRRIEIPPRLPDTRQSGREAGAV